MKAEINLENKAKFLALYWGQIILSHPDAFGLSSVCHEVRFDNAIANLKPLSQITDDDAIEIAKIVVGDQFENPLIIGQSYGYWLNKKSNYSLDWKVIDNLRSKGYALPWMGLSVDEMIEAGWIKLTEK
jgi:hypothetical protein